MIRPRYITQIHTVDRTGADCHSVPPKAARFICESSPKKFFILMERLHI